MQMREISSTTARLLSHLDRIEEIKKTGRIRPITIHIAPTDKCNLNCPFCSVKNRDDNELPLNSIKRIVEKYQAIGAKSIEITGGGDPTMHPRLEEIINYISDRKLSVGLITNGLLLNEVSESVLKRLTWLRISLSGVDFDLENEYLQLDRERLPQFTGCSYVYTPITTKERLEAVFNIASYLKAKYIRIVPNCYTPKDIEWGRENIPNAIKPYPPMFMQIKEYKTPSECYWRYIKPFVNSDGYVYQCSTCSLFAGRFPKSWKVAHWTEIDRIYKENPTPFNNQRCTLCFYSRQNDILRDLLTDVKHSRFL